MKSSRSNENCNEKMVNTRKQYRSLRVNFHCPKSSNPIAWKGRKAKRKLTNLSYLLLEEKLRENMRQVPTLLELMEFWRNSRKITASKKKTSVYSTLQAKSLQKQGSKEMSLISRIKAWSVARLMKIRADFHCSLVNWEKRTKQYFDCIRSEISWEEK